LDVDPTPRYRFCIGSKQSNPEDLASLLCAHRERLEQACASDGHDKCPPVHHLNHLVDEWNQDRTPTARFERVLLAIRTMPSAA